MIIYMVLIGGFQIQQTPTEKYEIFILSFSDFTKKTCKIKNIKNSFKKIKNIQLFHILYVENEH